jgi:23S rRNA (guanosine2251-2'-O)-methyltransferase
MTDSLEYQQKKRQFARTLTLFGRMPALEALQDHSLTVARLHLADSNKPADILREMQALAEARGVEVVFHDKQALSRISKNAKQDQGVALDVVCEKFAQAADLLNALPETFEMLAVDNVTNPQNLGMIIRSVCASPSLGLLVPERGCAKLDALVIKASAGTLFRAAIFRTQDLATTLADFAKQGTDIYGLDAKAKLSLQSFTPSPRSIYVLGNETEGLSPPVRKACTRTLSIPMCNGVESLNVSIAASLLAFRSVMR